MIFVFVIGPFQPGSAGADRVLTEKVSQNDPDAVLFIQSAQDFLVRSGGHMIEADGIDPHFFHQLKVTHNRLVFVLLIVEIGVNP